jgi:hypothetical protein
MHKNIKIGLLDLSSARGIILEDRPKLTIDEAAG